MNECGTYAGADPEEPLEASGAGVGAGVAAGDAEAEGVGVAEAPVTVDKLTP